MRPRSRLLLFLVLGLSFAALGPCPFAAADTPPADGAMRTRADKVYLALPLDQAGKLAEALPLYRARAEQTLTKSDRLRYAEALLRAGQVDEARRVYGLLAAEKGSVEHGDKTTSGAALAASSMLRAGFPALAVEYLRPAHRERPQEQRVALLLVRGLAAAGDPEGARKVITTIAKRADAWNSGERLELARWELLTGDAKAARALLDEKIPESVGQMVRDSIAANASLLARDWTKTSDLLAAAERKGPTTLSAARVDHAWRNLQRELRSIQLRRAVSLWKQGKRPAAVDEATNARQSDEEYVRSAATLLLVANDVAGDRRGDATEKLRVLAGRDTRFTGAVGQLEPALSTGAPCGDVLDALRGPVAAQDRSADLITTPLFEILSEAVAATPPAATARKDPEAKPQP